MGERYVLVLTSALALTILASAGQAADVVIAPTQDETDGARSSVRILLEDQAEGPSLGTPIPGGQRAGTMLWQRHFADPIYTSCGISQSSGLTFAGNWLNPPRQVEAVPLSGDGTVDWVSPGVEFYVDASRLGNVFAAVDINTADSTAVISGWMPGSSTPLWSHTVSPVRSLVYAGWASRKPIQVSDDGSTVAVALVTYTESGQQRGHLYAYDAVDGSTLADWEFPDGNVVATALSAGGRFMIMAGWPSVYVYDLVAGALRWSGPIGSGNDALAISADGEYIAWGWTTFHLRRWSGTSYAPYWTHTPGGGIFVGQCAFSPDDAFAVAWDNGSNMTNEVSVELYTLSTLASIWSHDYEGTPASTHVDIPTSMVFSPDGSRLAVSSWGGSFPEIHVFDAEDSNPVYTLDTPGSMFDVDIVGAPGGGHYITACGKSVHAGTSGRGEDFYAIEIPGDISGLETDFTVDFEMTLFPSPVRSVSTIGFTLDRPARVSLGIFDSSGRLVRALAQGSHAEGRHELKWRGDDSSGRPLKAGVYFLQLQDETRKSHHKIVLLD